MGKEKTKLIDGHVSLEQCKKAVDALLKHEKARAEKQQESLLLPGKEQNVWLQVTVKKMHSEKKLKPHKIPIAHPLVDPRVSPICLITKDPQREYKDLLEKHAIKFISRVVGVTKLKGKFKPFEARRLLLKENDLFLADERVVPLLPGLLGKKFFEAKKQPIPVNLTRKDLKGELERAVSSTYFHQNQGTCSSIKIGTLSQSSAYVLANLEAALPAVVKAIKEGWENVQSLHIKTNTSVSLPIWSCDLGAGDGGRWDGLENVEGLTGAEESEKEESEEEEQAAAPSRKKKAVSAVSKPDSKGKKRAADSEDTENPKKKAKASASTLESAPEASPIAPPPNTPAAGLAAPTPAGSKRKRRTKGSVGDTPITSVIQKLETDTKDGSSEEQPEPSGVKQSVKERATEDEPNAQSAEKSAKKPRHRKNKTQSPQNIEGPPASVQPSSVPEKTSEPVLEPVAQGNASGDAVAGAGKVAKKSKKQKAVSLVPQVTPVVPASATPPLTAEELKQKRSASSVEKKKEKAGKVKRSAKDAVIGKKV